MRLIKLCLVFSVFLCFLGTIWAAQHRWEWALTGIYMAFVTKYIVGVNTGSIIGSELVREKNVIQVSNLVGRK